MAFVDRFSVVGMENIPPVKAYLHAYQVETYGSDPVKTSRDYLISCLEKRSDKQQKSDFLLAAIWAEDGNKIIDFQGVTGIKSNWEANPGISAWKFEDGIYLPDPEEIWCEDVSIAFGREGEYRRANKTLSEYLSNWPRMDDLMVRLNDLPGIRNLREEEESKIGRQGDEKTNQNFTYELVFPYETGKTKERKEIRDNLVAGLVSDRILVMKLGDNYFSNQGEERFQVYPITTVTQIPEAVVKNIFSKTPLKGIRLKGPSIDIVS